MQVRAQLFDGPPEPLQLEVSHLARPLAYVTFGTVAHFARADRLADIVRATAAMVGTVVATTGPTSPTDLAGIPANVIARQYLPQQQILAHADVVVSHGRAGSTLGALLNGVPHLVLPQGAPSQQRCGEQLSRVGAGLMLQGPEQDLHRIASAVASLLVDPTVRSAARRIAAAILALPSAAQVARHITQAWR